MPSQAREIFGICFKNINRTITLTLRKVLAIGFGIIQIYEHISGMKFPLGNQVEKLYLREGISHSLVGAPRLKRRISILAAYRI